MNKFCSNFCKQIFTPDFFFTDFLPPQIIYGGKTEKCHPVYKFRQHFNYKYFFNKDLYLWQKLRFNASLSVCQKIVLHHLASAKFKNAKFFVYLFDSKSPNFTPAKITRHTVPLEVK
jgi:hypothetical protein